MVNGNGNFISGTIEKYIDEVVRKEVRRAVQALEEEIDKERWYNLNELSKYSGFSVSALKRWISLPKRPLPAVKIERKYVVRRKWYDIWFGQYRNRNGRVKRLVDIKSA